MKEFILDLFLTIKGIGAASGLIYQDSKIYVISDNSNYLYEYSVENQSLKKELLIADSPGENIKKSEKKDFESISSDGKDLYVFGSGSTAKRNIAVRYSPSSAKTDPVDFSEIFNNLQNTYAVDQDNFNIEGACFADHSILLFNRGNGPQNQNGIFSISTTEDTTSFTPIELPKIQNVASGFTDAVRVEHKIYFLATAEDVASNYLDGEVKGTLIGRMDFETKKIEFTQVISETHKFEGLTVYKEDNEKISFLLCEDSDSDTDESHIYKLTLPK
ncbi:DUF6929 family protein [Sphingobacterium hungaricum]